MIKVAVLDDYQNAFDEVVDTEKLKNKFDFKIFNEAFNDEDDTIEALEEFEALFIMRERTPITKNLLENLPNLKYIMTSGMRNNSINLEVTKKKRNFGLRHRNNLKSCSGDHLDFNFRSFKKRKTRN